MVFHTSRPVASNTRKVATSDFVERTRSEALWSVAAALLAPGTSRLSNPCFANDGLSALAMAGHLGAQIEEDGEDLLIHGGLNPIGTELNAGEAGLGIRLFTPIAALHDGPLTMVGEGSLAARPMGMGAARY